MKTLGLIGGTSWISTIEYYRLINELTNERLGGLNSAKLILHSINFYEFKKLLDASDWKQIAIMFVEIAKKLKTAGADSIVLCANTPHYIAEQIQQQASIPVLHIAEATAREVLKHKIKKILLLGTKFTMEQNFFKNILATHGIDTTIPEETTRDYIHQNIFSELGKGIFSAETKKKYLEIIDQYIQEGAEGVVFGCTEIPMLIKQDDCSVPTFDTTRIHSSYAVDFALSGMHIMQ